jgi:hypothetical protein
MNTMLDYQTRDRGYMGDRSRGAGMGRLSTLPLHTTSALRVRRVPLVDGYDPGGAYWGATIAEVGRTPHDLFCVWDPDGHVRYVRAPTVQSVRDQFPRASWPTDEGPSPGDVQDMFDAYVACALWSTNDDSGRPLDDTYGPADVHPDTLEAMRADVERFAREHGATIAACIGQQLHEHRRECDWALAGHHLWLTRNGHGVGFDDGDWPEAAGPALAEAARKLGDVELYIGDDDKIYT